MIVGCAQRLNGSGSGVQVRPLATSDDTLKPLAPADGEILKSFLTATVSWRYPVRENIEMHGEQYPYWSYDKVHLTVWPQGSVKRPIVDVVLPENITKWRFPVHPNQRYIWRVTPGDNNGDYPKNGFERRFATGPARIVQTTDAVQRYGNPRPGAHFRHIKPFETAAVDSISPWYEVSAYSSVPMPTFQELRNNLPQPVYDGHTEAVEMYWYAWRTFIEDWNITPEGPNHQAVAIINGTKKWGPWGSSVLWDNAAMMFFGRYGDQAYPFIKQYDNAYARQHENGFIAMEVGRDNREIYVWYPVVVPPLLSWAEWQYYLISGDRERLKRVFLPIVKNYEWWMTYMRRPDGGYDKEGLTPQDRLTNRDDGIMNSEVSANSFQALEALYLSKIASVIGRQDMQAFFEEEHAEIGRYINSHLWDDSNGIYADRCDLEHPTYSFSNGIGGQCSLGQRFVTKGPVGSSYKTTAIFRPLFARVVPEGRAQLLTAELMNAETFNRLHGVPNVSADSALYNANNQSIGGAWPIDQFMAWEGLKGVGRNELADQLAEKYFNSFVQAFAKEKTIKESIFADRGLFSGASDFVGWGGVAPISAFIEYVLGFQIDAPEKTITWSISKMERHGIENLGLGTLRISLICEERLSAKEGARVTVNSNGEFLLKLKFHDKVTARMIKSGVNKFDID